MEFLLFYLGAKILTAQGTLKDFNQLSDFIETDKLILKDVNKITKQEMEECEKMNEISFRKFHRVFYPNEFLFLVKNYYNLFDENWKNTVENTSLGKLNPYPYENK